MNEIKERLVDGDVHNQYAPCRYCGQLYITHGIVEYSKEELEKIGTGQCKCPDAIGERKKVRRRAEAKKIVAQWMPEDCEAQEFVMGLVRSDPFRGHAGGERCGEVRGRYADRDQRNTERQYPSDHEAGKEGRV